MLQRKADEIRQPQWPLQRVMQTARAHPWLGVRLLSAKSAFESKVQLPAKSRRRLFVSVWATRINNVTALFGPTVQRDSLLV